MQEERKKESKETSLIFVLVAIIIILVFVLGFVLGTKHNKTLINQDDVKESQKEEKEKEEFVTDSKPEEEIIGDTVDEELAKKAYEIIPKGYGLAEGFYQGKKIDLTTIDSTYKFAWLLSTMSKKYDIPVCSDKYLELTQEELRNNSIFEDNSFIEEAKKGLNKNNYYSEKDIYISYFWKYENGKFFVNDTNCDGRGTGATAFELFEYDSNKIHDNTLELFVRFGYFEPSIEDYEKNYFAYDIKDSYAKNAKVLKKDFDGKIDYDSDNNLLNISHAMYKFTFKIEGEKLYPLTVEMN